MVLSLMRAMEVSGVQILNPDLIRGQKFDPETHEPWFDPGSIGRVRSQQVKPPTLEFRGGSVRLLILHPIACVLRAPSRASVPLRYCISINLKYV